MQALCGLQGIFDLFNCKTPVLSFKTITSYTTNVMRICIISNKFIKSRL